MGPVLLAVLGGLLLLAGFAGCILPMLPGPPLAYAALYCVVLGKGWAYSATELVVLGVLTAVVTVVDTLLPVLGAKRYGASKAGVWLSVAGLLVGTFVFPPFGFLVGAFLGALVGELLAGKGAGAVRPAWGVFLGTLAGTGLKLATCAVITWYFVIGLSR
ncbi:MAG: DUF456 domain-containing protein [Planctomycetota bacterium]